MRILMASLFLICNSYEATAESYAALERFNVRTGWNGDFFAVVPQSAGAIINPAGCPTPDGYVAVIEAPGYRTYLTATLSAYFANRSLTVVIDSASGSCHLGRPKILGINLP